MEKQEIEKLKGYFNKLSSEEQWKWLVNTKYKPHFKVHLDNDSTALYFEGDKNVELVFYFKNSIGSRSGIKYLLRALDIKVEDV